MGEPPNVELRRHAVRTNVGRCWKLPDWYEVKTSPQVVRASLLDHTVFETHLAGYRRKQHDGLLH